MALVAATDSCCPTNVEDERVPQVGRPAVEHDVGIERRICCDQVRHARVGRAQRRSRGRPPVCAQRDGLYREALPEGVEVAVAQHDLERGEVLLQVLEREGAGDRRHRGRAPEQPRERDLCRRRTVSLRNDGERPAAVAAQGEEGTNTIPSRAQ